MYLTDKAAFDKMARYWTESFAMPSRVDNKEKIQRIVEMGFNETAAISALQATAGDENAALEQLLAG